MCFKTYLSWKERIIHRCQPVCSEDFAIMCNLPWSRGSDSLREQPGYEYTLEGAEDHVDTFIPPYFDNYGNPAGTYDIPESVPLFTDNDYSVPQPPARVPVARPREHSPHRVDPYAGGFTCQLRDPLPDTVNELKKNPQRWTKSICGFITGCCTSQILTLVMEIVSF